jgi:hypothetical protein
MKRQVIYDADDHEGYCFDVEKANEEGLYEDMRISIVHSKGSPIELVHLKEEYYDALREMLDLGVNVSPDTTQRVSLHITYVYGYGIAPEPAPVSS